ncbi:putative PABC (PABP) domain-containing protein [Helianthus anomalus]
MQQQMEPYGLMSPHPPGNVSMGSVPYDVLNAGGIFALTNASPIEQRTAQCSQMGPTPIPLAGASCMPMFPPGLGQQFFYGQAQPTFIPPQPGFGHRYQLVPGQHGPRPGGSHVGFHGKQIQQQPILLMQQQHQHQLFPGMSPNGRPMPNFYMPMVQPGQHGPRPRGSCVGVPGLQIQQQPVFLMQQQTVPYGPMSHHAPMSYPYDAGNVMQLSDDGGSSALANAFPTEQRNMLGENLYPLAEQRFFGDRNYHEH